MRGQPLEDVSSPTQDAAGQLSVPEPVDAHVYATVLAADAAP